MSRWSGRTRATGPSRTEGFLNDVVEQHRGSARPRPCGRGCAPCLYQWFDPSAFAHPGGGPDRVFSPTTSYAGVHAISVLPSAWGMNASLFKDFRLHGNLALQLRFEWYNVFIHANLNWPIRNLSDSDFGKIRGKFGDGRRVQLGARLRF